MADPSSTGSAESGTDTVTCVASDVAHPVMGKVKTCQNQIARFEFPDKIANKVMSIGRYSHQSSDIVFSAVSQCRKRLQSRQGNCVSLSQPELHHHRQ